MGHEAKHAPGGEWEKNLKTQRARRVRRGRREELLTALRLRSGQAPIGKRSRKGREEKQSRFGMQEMCVLFEGEGSSGSPRSAPKERTQTWGTGQSARRWRAGENSKTQRSLRVRRGRGEKRWTATGGTRGCCSSSNAGRRIVEHASRASGESSFCGQFP